MIDYQHEAERLAQAIAAYLNGGGGYKARERLRERLGDFAQAKTRAAAAKAQASQGDLFGSPMRGTAPSVRQDTSIAAGASMPRDRILAVKRKVLLLLSSRPLSDQELVQRLGVPENTLRPRRIELVSDGLVIDSGIRRRTESGREAIVWCLTEAGAARTRELQSPNVRN